MALFQLLVAVLLFLNALAILNEERFLAKLGWHNGNDFSSGAHSKSLKSQALGVINAVSYMRMPLTVLNSVVVAVKLVFG